MRGKRVLTGIMAAVLMMSGNGVLTFANETQVSAPVVTELPGTESTQASYNTSFLSVTGFAKEAVNDRTAYIDTEYYRVANDEEAFLQALDDAKKGTVKVIEIAADMELGWDALSEQEQAHSCISKYGWDAGTEVFNPSIRETNVSQLTISDTKGLTIFSRAGCTVKHAEWKLQGSSADIVIRNIKFDEMWNWSEAASTKELGWTLMKLNGVKGVWIDHCTFTLGSDGNMDSENGASDMTMSWNVYSLPASENPGTDSMLYKTITYLEYRYQQGTLSDNGRYAKLRKGGASPEQIMAYEAYHQKLCLNGSGDKDFMDGYSNTGENLKDGNQRLHLTLAYNKINNIGARLPWVRQGTGHLINCYLDDSGHMSLHNDESLPFGEYGGWELNCVMDAHDGACIGADTCVFNEARVLVGIEKQDGREGYDSTLYPDGYCYAGMQVPFNYSFANAYNHMLAVNSKVTLNGETYIGSSWDNNGDNLFTVDYTWFDKSTIGDFKWYSSIDNVESYTKGQAPFVTDENGNVTYIPFTFSYTDTLGYAYQKLPLEEVEETVETYAGAYKFNEGPEFWLRTSYAADEAYAPVASDRQILADGVRMDKTELTVNAGEVCQLSALATPSNVTEKELTWASSDTDVAEVKDSGLLIPKKAGTAQITAATKDGTAFSASCAVTVTVGVKSIAIEAPATTLYLGDEETPAETMRLTAVVTPEDATNSQVIWSSSNETVLQVDENGVLTPLKNGSCTITCTSVSDPAVTASKRFTVKKGVNPNPATPEPTIEPTIEPTQTPETSEAPVLYGDVTLDGSVAADDALFVLQAVVKLTTLDEAQTRAANVDGDSDVTASDALYILQKVVKLIGQFPIEA